MGAQAKACATRRATESATENRPPAERSTVASRRETCETSSKCTQRLARVKRWGKSPPLRWRHRRQGKPRVVQGQIGGESRPGSIKPSGRLLDPGSDAGTRGMIAVTRSSLRELRAAQNPAYRPVRQYLFCCQMFS